MIRLEPVESRKAILSQLLWFLLWVGATVAALWLRPDPAGHGTHTQLGLPPCPSTLMFSRPCPGCGLTTSFTATVHLAFVDAWNAHAFGPFLYLGFTVSAGFALWAWIRRRRIETIGALPDTLLVLFAVVFVGYGFLRFYTADPEAYRLDVSKWAMSVSASP